MLRFVSLGHCVGIVADICRSKGHVPRRFSKRFAFGLNLGYYCRVTAYDLVERYTDEWPVFGVEGSFGLLDVASDNAVHWML